MAETNTIEDVIALLIDGCNEDRGALHALRHSVNYVTATCVDAKLDVEGPDVRPVLRALVDEELAKIAPPEED